MTENCLLLFASELMPEQRARFNYLDDNDLNSRQFFVFAGAVHSLTSFLRVPVMPPRRRAVQQDLHTFDTWDMFHAGENHTGMLARFSNNRESVFVARY